MEVKNLTFIFICLYLLGVIVSSKSIGVDSVECGSISIKDNVNNKTRSFLVSGILSEIPISGGELNSNKSKLKDFLEKHMHWIITNITVKPGKLFRLCATNCCQIFDENYQEIDKNLVDLDYHINSANCYVKKNIPNNKTCSELSSELLNNNECARFYRSPSCNGMIPYESVEENGTLSFENETYESLAVRNGCEVVIYPGGIPTKTYQENLFAFYKRSLTPNAAAIKGQCYCEI